MLGYVMATQRRTRAANVAGMAVFVLIAMSLQSTAMAFVNQKPQKIAEEFAVVSTHSILVACVEVMGKVVVNKRT